MDLRKLQEPFPADAIEWRIGRAGYTKAGKLYGTCLAYLTNRAIMQRLDDVCGPLNWKNEYKAGPMGGILCGLSLYDAEKKEWIQKWDGAENTDIEAVKGGLSDAMKRAAVQFGIGRYLYDLEEGYTAISDNGKHYAKGTDKHTKKEYTFKWDPPKLPDWALPPPVPTKAKEPKKPAELPTIAWEENGGRTAKPTASTTAQQSRVLDLCKELNMDVARDICTPMKAIWPLTFQQSEAVIKRLEQKKLDLAKELDAK